MHDLAIRKAVVVDGLGNPAFEGELAISHGRIAEVGQTVGDARENIDADGLTLAPGIIDLHTHFDAQLTWDPYATPSNRLGVTTVVIGNCGFTIAPCKPGDRERILKNLTHVEGMSLEAMQEGIDWDFETFPDYMNSLERRGLVPNVAAFCGHSSVRTWVLGSEASDRTATAEEVAEMKQLVLEALEAGACGFATSTLEQHNGHAGIPMPSRLADEHEMFELTGALG
ncbi:MAG: amidohydrolase family protein, partial [Pseudomonadota bacterium]|nr:amidohydrolase family protein [Pseudomonadota bacterium]